MKKMIPLFAITAISTAAMAADRDAFYGSLGGGVYNLETEGFDETAATMKIIGGYNFSENVAVEASYSRLFESSAVVDDVNVEIDGNVWDLSTKLSLPMGNRLTPYGRLGWSYVDLSALATADSESMRFNNYDNAFTWAVGTGISFSSRLGLNAEVARTMIDDGDLDFLSVHLDYRFGAQ